MKKTEPGAIRETLRIYRKHILEHWPYTLGVSVLVSVGSSLVFYVPPLIIASIISNANDANPITLENGAHYALLFGIAWLAGEMLWRLAFSVLQVYARKAYEDFYSLAVRSLLEKDTAFFNDRFAGSITKNTLAFGRQFDAFFSTIILDIVSSIVPAFFALIVLAFISPTLSIALLLMIVISIWIITPLLKKRAKYVHDREEKHAIMSGHISDVVSNIAAVKAHGLETKELLTNHRYVKQFSEAAYKSWQFHNNRIDMLISPIYVLTNVIGLLIILSIGVDNSTKAQLFLAFSYYSTFSRFLWSFNSIYRRLEESVTESALFTSYLLIKSSVTDIDDAKAITVKHGNISFENVSFNHSKAGVENLFRDFSLTIPAGQKVGLVGHSGAGKSTLVALLERFVNVDSGKITIDSQDIASITQESLHQSISYVPQEPLLFHRSLRENIAYGKPDATEDEVKRAAREAYAVDFIETLPDGFDTLVGERGVKLSGGQRQRIAIARAILKNAPILLLDEATSALDSESEKLIQASFETLMKDRTSIVVAHRLSTIAKLDRIIVIDSGKIIEDGSHKDLLEKNGAYARLWKHQSGGFIEE